MTSTSLQTNRRVSPEGIWFTWSIAFLLASAMPAESVEPWHLPGWQARAVVEIPQPSTEGGVDTAAVRVLCQDRAKIDGSDYRVLDAAGKPVPFQITFHDAERYSLLSFRVANPRQTFFVYFHNPQAARAADEVVADSKPGSGPPRGAWVPRYGFVLETRQRPDGANPKTVDEMASLIARSPWKHGGRYQRRVADGYNSFGSSDNYLSMYRGWVRVEKPGKYQFCTVSNEASFSFLDGKELVHWPGRHTVERGLHGEKNAAVELSAGLHYLEYYHEEVTLDQMAYLGWRPSADAGAFSPIPESFYTAPHDAVVRRYENAQGPLLHFEPIITDSVWPAERHEGQYTRCHFQAPPLAAGTTIAWNFGDGQTAAGPTVDHVYLTLGHFPVSLTAQGPGGKQEARWPLRIYEIENVTEQFKEGKPKDYAGIARTYDRGKLSANCLRDLAFLMAESELPADALQTANDFVARFGSSQPALIPSMRRLMAECSLHLGKEGLEQAVANFQASLTRDTPVLEKLEVLAKLIRLVGIDRREPEKAQVILQQVEETVRGARMDEETRRAYRRAVIAAGDVWLWYARPEKARETYLRAEELNPDRIPPQVRAARTGSYPNSIRDFLANGNFGAALDLVDRWEDSFPTEKLQGKTFFWRGKVFALRGQPREAARFLARAVGLAPGSSFESETRWLLAVVLEEQGRKEEARRELAKLVASGIQDEFSEKAREKLRR